MKVPNPKLTEQIEVEFPTATEEQKSALAGAVGIIAWKHIDAATRFAVWQITLERIRLVTHATKK
jgi:hypothetical protein